MSNEQIKLTLQTLISWIAQSAAAPITLDEGKKLLQMLDEEKPGVEPDGLIVSMIEFQGKIYVASQFGIYVKTDKGFERIVFVNSKHGIGVGSEQNS